MQEALTPWLPAQPPPCWGQQERTVAPAAPRCPAWPEHPASPRAHQNWSHHASHSSRRPHASKASTGPVPSAATHHLHSSDPISSSSPTFQNSCLCHLELMDCQGKLLLWMPSPPAWPNLNLGASYGHLTCTLSSGSSLLSMLCSSSSSYVVVIISDSYSANTTGPGAWGECPPSTPLQLLDHSSTFFLKTLSSFEFCAFRLTAHLCCCYLRFLGPP